MPSRKRKDYNLVDDGHDARLPMHNEEAFKHGIPFKSKYIGTLDVPRPTGRMEIVVAMRRIRYEFKAKAIKKKKVDVIVSVDGVKVTQRKKKKKKQMWAWDLDRLNIMNDPVYRIFYVSHDSHDLKIWSYIARDGQSNVFRCNVFKSPKKSQAMQVVRTIGQAFEVSHKLSAMISPKREGEKEETDGNNDTIQMENEGGKEEADKPEDKTQEVEEASVVKTNDEVQVLKPSDISIVTGGGTLSTHHTIQLLQQKLNQTEQQAQVAMAQVHLLKDQLTAESTARIESQARNHQLLIQNKEQIEQMSKLVDRISKLEKILNEKLPEGVDSFSLLQDSGDITSNELLLDISTPAPGAVHIPALADIDMSKDSPFMDIGLFANTNTNNANEPLTNGHFTITPMSSERSVSQKLMDDSSSSSSDEEGLMNTPSTRHWPRLQLLNNNQTKDTINTSVWTSGALTPDNKLTTTTDQMSLSNHPTSLSNDLTMSLDNSDSNLTNGYTLSPIMDSSHDGSSSLFRHFSLLDSEDPPKFNDSTSMNEDTMSNTSKSNIIRWKKPNSPTKTTPDAKLLSNNSSLSLISAPPVPSPRKSIPTDPGFRQRPSATTPLAFGSQSNSSTSNVSHKNPFKDFEPRVHKELTKSKSFPSSRHKIFSSPEQFNNSLKYEPIRKEVAAEHTENLLNSRLNSTFSGSDSARNKIAESLNQSYTAVRNITGVDAPVLKSSSAFSPDFSAIMDCSVNDSSFENSRNELFIDETSLKEGRSEKQPYAQLIKSNSKTNKDNFFHQPIGSEFYRSKNSVNDSIGSSPDGYLQNQSSGFDSGVADETGSDIPMKN